MKALKSTRLALVEEQKSRLLKLVFTQTVRWDMAREAAVIIKGSKLSKPLLALYSQCQVVKDKAPSLVVREKSAKSALWCLTAPFSCEWWEAGKVRLTLKDLNNSKETRSARSLVAATMNALIDSSSLAVSNVRKFSARLR